MEGDEARIKGAVDARPCGIDDGARLTGRP
jgi:hypothetical protein